MSTNFAKPVSLPHQRGSALLVALVLVLALALIGITIVRSSGSQVVAGTNTQMATEALNAAEDSELAAERRVFADFNGVPTFDFDTNHADGLYMPGGVTINSTDWSHIAHESAGTSTYTVEYLGPAPVSSLVVGGVSSEQRYLFRATGHGGSSRGSARVVQTIVATAE
jgi:Tfp pilus assembly protein PilX